MGTQCEETMRDAHRDALLQSFSAACADDVQDDCNSARLVHLLRCSLLLGDPTLFVREEGKEGKEWGEVSRVCHRLRENVDDLRLTCMRFVCLFVSHTFWPCTPFLSKLKN